MQSVGLAKSWKACMAPQYHTTSLRWLALAVSRVRRGLRVWTEDAEDLTMNAAAVRSHIPESSLDSLHDRPTISGRPGPAALRCKRGYKDDKGTHIWVLSPNLSTSDRVVFPFTRSVTRYRAVARR